MIIPIPVRYGLMEVQTPMGPFLSRWPMANSNSRSGVPSRTRRMRKGIMKAPETPPGT